MFLSALWSLVPVEDGGAGVLSLSFLSACAEATFVLPAATVVLPLVVDWLPEVANVVVFVGAIAAGPTRPDAIDTPSAARMLIPPTMLPVRKEASDDVSDCSGIAESFLFAT